MLRTVQLSLRDDAYRAAVREALSHSCAWHVESVDAPDPAQPCVQVVDEVAFARLPLPLPHPERVVLVTPRKDSLRLAEAWEAGIVSVVSLEDPMSTVLLAILSTGLRVGNPHSTTKASGISPSDPLVSAPIAPTVRNVNSKRWKIQ
jgi:hypothetical protein